MFIADSCIDLCASVGMSSVSLDKVGNAASRSSVPSSSSVSIAGAGGESIEGAGGASIGGAGGECTPLGPAGREYAALAPVTRRQPATPGTRLAWLACLLSSYLIIASMKKSKLTRIPLCSLLYCSSSDG